MSDLIAAVRDPGVARLEEEIGRGDVNSKEYSSGDTALHAAARWGRLDAVRLLLSHGADACALNFAGKTPLHCAAAEGHGNVCELLLSGGANATVDTPDVEGACPLLPAAGKGHTDTVRLLIAHGASVNQPDTAHGLTPLLWASARGHVAIVQMLLSNSAAVDVPDIVWMDTPLHGAVKGGHAHVVALLVSHSATVNARAKDGSTPLHYAAKANRPEIVRALVAAGADLTIEDGVRKFPRDVASDTAAFDKAAWGASEVDAACPPIGVVVGSVVDSGVVVVGRPVGDAVLDTDEVGTSCVVCFKAPINATIVHGETGHVCCCVGCAKQLQAMRQPCPLCREPIAAVVRNFHA